MHAFCCIQMRFLRMKDLSLIALLSLEQSIEKRFIFRVTYCFLNSFPAQLDVERSKSLRI